MIRSKASSRLAKLLGILLAAVVGVQVGLPVAFSLARNRLLFFPRTGVAPERGLARFGTALDARLIQVERPDGRRLATYDVRPSSEAAPSEPVVLFLHGNAGDIAMRASLLARLVRETKLRWVMPDYSGFGGNQGAPSEAEVCRDGVAVFDAIVASGVAPEQIVLFGESMGGAIALSVASERDAAGVLLQSTFASISSMARERYPWLPLLPFLSAGAFPSAERIAQLEIPVQLFHGEEDRVIPITQSEALFTVAPKGSQFTRIASAGHGDLFDVAGVEYIEQLGRLCREWVQKRRGD